MSATITIVGNLGRDAEGRFTPTGKEVTNYSVASNRQYTNSAGEKVKETTWFRITSWGNQGKNDALYLHKGDKVLVKGRLTPDPKTGGPRIWTGENGVGASYEVTAEQVEYLTSKGGDEEAGELVPETDEVPF